RNVGQLEDALSSIEINMTSELYQKVASLTPEPPPATDRTDDLR
ncbi:MAG: aldo/keto reductase, partial [Desulfobacula sp.]|nr:aldo/keto reductase [Desulfobacula sp.]